MASSSSSSGTGGVPPGFRFHPTDEELLLYYLKKKVAFEKFDLEVIREVDLNRTEPWDLQERCRIGSTPQNEWYFFSHKDRKYPTGSRTNRATDAGFWKATGRDKCIRTSYRKIGMRKTLVFYRGRAPHGQKTDWIMHEYRLEDSDNPQLLQAAGASEDGWVVCRVFKKKCFFKIGAGAGVSGEGSGSQGIENHLNADASHDQSQYMHPNLNHHRYHHGHYHHQHHNPGVYYSQVPTNSYPMHVQVQDLLTNQRPSGYEFSGLPNDSAAMVKPYEQGGLDVGGGACEGMQHVADQRRQQSGDEWAVLGGMDGRFGGGGAASVVQPLNQRSGEMNLWGYGK